MNIIKGIKLEAFDSKGDQISHFEIVKIKDFYYGVHNVGSIDKDYLELRVLKND